MKLILIANCSLLYFDSNDVNSLKSVLLGGKYQEVQYASTHYIKEYSRLVLTISRSTVG